MIFGTPIELPEAMLQAYPELRRVRVRRGGVPPRLGGLCLGQSTVAGITLWDTVFLAPDVPLDAGLLLHELRHVQQFEADPLFPVRYIWESIRRGYRANRYELDADAFVATHHHPTSPP